MLVRNKLIAAMFKGLGGVPSPTVEPSLRERFFRRNEGTTDYATIPTVTLSNPVGLLFDFDVYMDSVVSASFISLKNTSNGEVIAVAVANGNWKISTDRGTPTEGSAATVGVWAKVQLYIDGTELVLYVDGVEDYRVSPSGGVGWLSTAFDEAQLWRGTNGVSSNCIVANLKIYDAGTLERYYKLADNSDTLVDSANAQNGTVINGNTDDWGLFQDQPTLWKGQGLTVPPWDSVDQDLLKP